MFLRALDPSLPRPALPVLVPAMSEEVLGPLLVTPAYAFSVFPTALHFVTPLDPFGC